MMFATEDGNSLLPYIAYYALGSLVLNLILEVLDLTANIIGIFTLLVSGLLTAHLFFKHHQRLLKNSEQWQLALGEVLSTYLLFLISCQFQEIDEKSLLILNNMLTKPVLVIFLFIIVFLIQFLLNWGIIKLYNYIKER